MQTGYKLKDFIDFMKLEEKAKNCVKYSGEIKSAAALNEFYNKAKGWISKNKEGYMTECEKLGTVFG